MTYWYFLIKFSCNIRETVLRSSPFLSIELTRRNREANESMRQWQRMQHPSGNFVTSVIFISLVIGSCAEFAKHKMPLDKMDPIDTCLIICDMCYKVS